MTIPGIFSQRDGRWAAQELGFNTDPYYNLYHFGCAVDAAANLIWWVTGDASWTPDRVNLWLTGNGGFAAGGGLIVWAGLANLMRTAGLEYHGFTTDLNGTNNFLRPESNFAIAQLTGPGFPMHFSAMPYVGQIADSWDARLKPVGTYKFIGAHLFAYVKAVPVPAAAPLPVLSPAPVQAPVAAPLPDPTPEPVPSNPQPQGEPAPEYVTSYTKDTVPETKTITVPGVAVDVTTGKVVAELVKGQLITVAGTFTYQGQIYYRSLFAEVHHLWNGIDVRFFAPVASSGQANGTVSVTQVPGSGAGPANPASDKRSVLELIKELVAQVVAAILRRKNS